MTRTRALVVALSLVLGLGGCTDTNAPDDGPFTSAAWIGAAPDSGARLGMLADLKRRERLIGRSRDEVVTLLGEPDRASWSSGAPHPAYTMGWVDSLSEITTVGLVIRFAEDDRVVGHMVLPSGFVPERYRWDLGKPPSQR